MGAFDECIDCTKRYPACQDSCPIGRRQKRKYMAEQEKIRKAKASDKLSRDYVWEHYEGCKK